MSLFINKARVEGRNDAIYYVLGFIVSLVLGQIIGSIPILMLMISKGNFDSSVLSNPTVLGISSNTFFVLMMLPFVMGFLLLWVFIRFVHKKRFIVSLTAFDRFDWKKVWFAFGLWMLFSVVIEVVSYIINPSNYVFNYSGSSFWMLLVISLTLLPIQTSLEELLFRSYLMQGIGMIKPYRMIPFVVTSVAFGLMHIANPEVGEYGYVTLISYIGIGLLLGLLTILSDSMEFALGLHAANNIYSAVFVGFKSSALPTETLFYTKEVKMDLTANLLFIGVLIVFYWIVNKRYQLLPINALWQRFDTPLNQEDLNFPEMDQASNGSDEIDPSKNR